MNDSLQRVRPGDQVRARSVPEPIDNLLAVQALVRDHGPPDLVQWLEAGICAYLSGADLSASLQLKAAPTERSAATRHRFSTRNKHLRVAWNNLAVGDIGDWQRAKLLAEAIRTFEQTVWPTWKWLDRPPLGASKVNTHLFYAKDCGELPGGVRHLYRIFHAVTDTSYSMLCQWPAPSHDQIPPLDEEPL